MSHCGSDQFCVDLCSSSGLSGDAHPVFTTEEDYSSGTGLRNRPHAWPPEHGSTLACHPHVNLVPGSDTLLYTHRHTHIHVYTHTHTHKYMYTGAHFWTGLGYRLFVEVCLLFSCKHMRSGTTSRFLLNWTHFLTAKQI